MCRDQASLSMHMETWSLERCARQKEDLYSGKHSQPCSKTSSRLMPPWSRCVEPVEGPRRGWMMFFHLELVGLKVGVPKSIHVKLRKKPVGPASNNNISGVLVSKNWRRKKLFQVVGQWGRCYHYPLGPGLALVWMGYGFEAGKVSSRSRYFC